MTTTTTFPACLFLPATYTGTNYDLGGLDGGTLSSYVCAIAESYGVPQ